MSGISFITEFHSHSLNALFVDVCTYAAYPGSDHITVAKEYASIVQKYPAVPSELSSNKSNSMIS